MRHILRDKHKLNRALTMTWWKSSYYIEFEICRQNITGLVLCVTVKFYKYSTEYRDKKQDVLANTNVRHTEDDLLIYAIACHRI